MPNQKLVFGPEQFTQGLSPSQTSGNSWGGFFAQAEGIDLFRHSGMISPAINPTVSTPVTFFHGEYYSNINTISGLVFGITYPGSSGGSHVVVNMDAITSPFTGIASTVTDHIMVLESNPLQPLYAGYGNNFIFVKLLNPSYSYPANTQNRIFYCSDSYLGYLNTDTGVFYDSWSIEGTDGAGTNAPTWSQARGLATAPHRLLFWNGYLYILNGQFVGRYDSTIPPQGDLNTEFFALPPGYQAQDIKLIQNELYIYCTNGDQSAVVTWDGKSLLANDILYSEAEVILAAATLGSFPSIVSSGNTGGLAIKNRNYYGYFKTAAIFGNNGGASDTIWDVPYTLNTSSGVGISGTYPGNISTYDNLILVANTASKAVYAYGTPFPGDNYRNLNSGLFPQSLTSPYIANEVVTSITTSRNAIYMATASGNLEKVYLGNAPGFQDNASDEASFETNNIELPPNSTVEKVRFKFSEPRQLATDYFSVTLVMSSASTSSAINLVPLGTVNGSELDENGQTKTFYNVSGMCDSFALRVSYAVNTANNPVPPISAIEVEFRAGA